MKSRYIIYERGKKGSLDKNEIIELLTAFALIAPNTEMTLKYEEFGYDTDGFVIRNSDGRELKRYKTFVKAIDYLYEND